MSDKVRELAVDLLAALCDIDKPLNTAIVERILRDKLYPLLDSVDRALSIAFHAHGMCDSDCTVSNCQFTRLSAELKDWQTPALHSMERTPER